jgi:predicted nucleotidyltransferase
MSTGVDRLPEPARKPLESLRDELLAAQGENLAALIVYGSAVRGGYDPQASDIDVVVVLRDTSLPRLKACSTPLLKARFTSRVEAMILKLDNLAAAADVFPLLYDDIRSRHVVLAGKDPFSSLEIADEHRRLRIEQELREARIRMRRAIVDAQGEDSGVAAALARKVKQIRGPLHALLRLKGVSCEDTIEVVLREVGKGYGIDTLALLDVRRHPESAHQAFRSLMDAAIADVDQLEVGGRP